MTLPNRPRASNIDDGTTRDGGDGDYFGNRFAKETVTLRKLKFSDDRKKPCVNTFRLFPAPDPTAPGVFQPTRIPADEPGARPLLTDFIQRFLVFRGGSPGVTYILYNPDEHPGASKDDMKWRFPATVICGAVATARKRNEGEVYWQALMDGDKGKSAVLKWPSWMYLAFGALYELGSESLTEAPLGLDPNGKPLLLDLGNDTGSKVHALCSQLRVQYEALATHGGLPDESEVPTNKLYRIGDPIALDKGVFFRAFGLNSPDPRALDDKLPDPPRRFDLPAEEKKQNFGFDVYAVKTFAGLTPDLSAYADVLWPKLGPISGQLIFLTAEEQVAIMAERLKRPDGRPALDLLEYAFRNRDEEDDWLDAIPETVRNRARGRTTSVPGAQTTAAPRVRPAPPVQHETRALASVPVDDDEDEDDGAAEARRMARRQPATRPDVSVPVPPVETAAAPTAAAAPAAAPFAPRIKAATPAPSGENEDEDDTTPAATPGAGDDDEDALPETRPAPRQGRSAGKEQQFLEPPPPTRPAAPAPVTAPVPGAASSNASRDALAALKARQRPTPK
jgi:hypothetical protein